MKERGAKVLKKKKKKKGQNARRSDRNSDDKNKPKSLYSRESEAQMMLQAMAHNNEQPTEDSKDGYMYVPTGPGKGSGGGVYFVDFSKHYKRLEKVNYL